MESNTDICPVEGIKILNLFLIENELIVLDWGLLLLQAVLITLKRVLKALFSLKRE